MPRKSKDLQALETAIRETLRYASEAQRPLSCPSAVAYLQGWVQAEYPDLAALLGQLRDLREPESVL